MFFGIEAAFLDSIGELLSVEVSKAGEGVSRCLPFDTITNTSMEAFDLRAPFSGRVCKVNQEAIDYPGLVREDPRGKGWLIEVEPTDAEGEAGDTPRGNRHRLS